MKRQKLLEQIQKKYGVSAASTGAQVHPLDVIPTGVLSLDYRLGVGGWPRRHVVGVFGAPGIGKSSLSYSAIAQAQKLDLDCAIVLVEPHFDPYWIAKFGVDPERLIISRPENGREAFDHLFMFVEGGISLVIMDSIGALLSPTEAELEGQKQAGGQAGLITWGVKRILGPAYRNNVCVMLLNQVRDAIGSMYPVLNQPGGHHLEHAERVICHLRRGGKDTVYKAKDETGDEIEVGRQLVAHLVKNQLAQGTGQKAVFDFYQKEMEGLPFGIDTFSDVVATAASLSVIQRGGAWYTLPDGSKHMGMKDLKAHLAAHPKKVEQIRLAVLDIMKGKAFKPKISDDT